MITMNLTALQALCPEAIPEGLHTALDAALLHLNGLSVSEPDMSPRYAAIASLLDVSDNMTQQVVLPYVRKAADELSRLRTAESYANAWVWTPAELRALIRGCEASCSLVLIRHVQGAFIMEAYDSNGDYERNWSIPTVLKNAYECLKELPYDLAKQLSTDAITHCMQNSLEAGQMLLTLPKNGTVISMRNGRAVKRLLPHLDDAEVKRLAAELLASQSAYSLHFTKDREEVSRVYRRGPDSCMSYDFEWLYARGEPVHPSEVYCHPENDLAVAYITDSNEVIVARALVNTSSKLFTRVYGKEDRVSGIISRTETLLKQQGYTKTSRDDWNKGQKLLRIDTDCGGIVCPYLDPGNVGVTVEDDCLVVYGYEDADHSTGCLEQFPPEGRERCDECSECNGDLQEALDIRGDSHNVCESCIEYRYRYALCAERGYDIIVHEANSDLAETVDGSILYIGNCSGDYYMITMGYYEGRWAESDDIVMCADEDVWHVGDIGRELVEYDGEYYRKGQYALLDGQLVPYDNVQYDAVRIDEDHVDFDNGTSMRQYITEVEEDEVAA